MNPYNFNNYYDPYGYCQNTQFYNFPGALPPYNHMHTPQIIQQRPKILINPNFQPPKIHINPNFKKDQKTSIYVNPNVINLNFSGGLDAGGLKEPPKPGNLMAKPLILPEKPLISTKTKLVRKMPIPAQKTVKNVYKVVNTTPKTINNKVLVQNKVDINQKLKNSPFLRKRKISFHSKYKIVRKSINLGELNSSKSVLVKNRFKLDRRSVKKSPKKFISTEKIALKKIVRNGEFLSKLVTLNRLSYKTALSKGLGVGKAHKTVNKCVKNILINGQIYKTGKNQLSLKKMSPESKIKRRRTKSLVECNAKLKLNKSASNSTKLKKSNLACPYFKKYGRCRFKENGKCIKKHDPNQIIICPRFLQGACLNEKCLLSHKVLPEKMPTCKFFLAGMCFKNDCCYLHVKINANAEICRQFLEGYCEKGAECSMRHQYLCPDFEAKRKCPRVRCPFPHGLRVRDICLQTVAKKFKVLTKKNQEKTKNCANKIFSEEVTHLRYYSEDQKDSKSIENGQKVIENDQKLIEISQNLLENVPKESEIELKRPKLGTLPSFIPFS